MIPSSYAFAAAPCACSSTTPPRSGIRVSGARPSFASCSARWEAAIPLRLRPQHRARRGVYLNADCVVLDCADVEIGTGALIGPAVQIYAATHPTDPEQRRVGLE